LFEKVRREAGESLRELRAVVARCNGGADHVAVDRYNDGALCQIVERFTKVVGDEGGKAALMDDRGCVERREWRFALGGGLGPAPPFELRQTCHFEPAAPRKLDAKTDHLSLGGPWRQWRAARRVRG